MALLCSAGLRDEPRMRLADWRESTLPYQPVLRFADLPHRSRGESRAKQRGQLAKRTRLTGAERARGSHLNKTSPSPGDYALGWPRPVLRNASAPAFGCRALGP